jgi:hypothetical protein
VCEPCPPLKLEPCNYCSECDCCFDTTIDFILWKPCLDNIDYAMTTEPADGDLSARYKHHAVDPKWQPGVRVALNKPNVCCGWGIGGSYTYLRDSSDDRVEGTVYPILLHPGIVEDAIYTSARCKYEYHYNAFDVLFSHSFVHQKCNMFTPFIGVQGLALEQTARTRYQLDETSSTSSKWCSDFIGAGLKVGAEYIFKSSDCLAFFAKTAGAIVAGNTDAHIDIIDSTNTTTTRFEESDNCRFLNGYHFQAGLLYDWDVCGCETYLRLGYEFVKWHNISNPRVYTNDGDGLARGTSPDSTTLGYHGLFAGVEMKF